MPQLDTLKLYFNIGYKVVSSRSASSLSLLGPSLSCLLRLKLLVVKSTVRDTVGAASLPDSVSNVLSSHLGLERREWPPGLCVQETFRFWYVELLSNPTWATPEIFQKRASNFMKEGRQ